MSALNTPATSMNVPNGHPLCATLDELFQPRDDATPVIDPTLWKSYRRIYVPLTAITKTTGDHLYPCGETAFPSVCGRFLKGRCPEEEKCEYIHVDPDYITSARTLLKEEHSHCCAKHGDMPSVRDDFRKLCSKMIFVYRGVTIPSECIGFTIFWDHLFLLFQSIGSEDVDTIEFHRKEICGYHQKGDCKYNVDCDRVHICREFWKSHLDVFDREGYANPFETPRTISAAQTAFKMLASHPHELDDHHRETDDQPKAIFRPKRLNANAFHDDGLRTINPATPAIQPTPANRYVPPNERVRPDGDVRGVTSGSSLGQRHVMPRTTSARTIEVGQTSISVTDILHADLSISDNVPADNANHADRGQDLVAHSTTLGQDGDEISFGTQHQINYRNRYCWK